MLPEREVPLGGWERLVGWFIEHRLIVWVLSGMLVFAGLRVAPFDWNLGWLPRDPVPVDAIPDIGENQQIVFTEWPGRSPRDVEDQITYPLTTALLGIPGVRTIRSSSAFGFSEIYIIFNDEIDFYWSRSRILEKLSSLPPMTVPEGVMPMLGPDATALGQVYWYTLEGRDKNGNTVGGFDPDELRAIQDWQVRYALQGVEGVSEVASVGGFVREYQVDVDPAAMRAHNVSLGEIADAVRRANLDAGARTLEINNVEYVIRGLGFVRSLADLEATVVVARQHTPIRIRDVARVALGPGQRRGVLDDAGGPAVGGVVVARYRANPLEVIQRVKARIAEIAPGLPRRALPDGTESQVTIAPFYDRTQLIHETLDTLADALFEEILITLIVVLVMLRNLRSSVLIATVLPLGVLASFMAMKATGVDANIMALGGIAIAIGEMVDIGIVFVENMDQHLAGARGGADRAVLIRRAAGEVAPAVLTTVMTTVVSFLPVFGLTSAELRLFAPMALTKTYAMLAALVLAMLIIPGAAVLILRAKPERPADAPPGWRGVVRAAFRLVHTRDWLFTILGVVLLGEVWWAGLLVLALGLFRLARPHLSGGWVARFEVVENALATVAVVGVLAAEWSPLGADRGLGPNLVFAGGLVTLVMGSFRLFEAVYPVLLRAFLRHKLAFLAVPALVTLFGFTAAFGFERVFGWLPSGVRQNGVVVAVSHALPGFGREFMPPLDEGSYLYMPSTMPHAAIGEVAEALAAMDAAIAAIPEVERAVGKAGRAESALDPAPISMIETVIIYKPEYREDEDGNRVRQWREHIRSPRDIWDEIVKAAQRPGMTSAPELMPIAARLVMLQSGMRAPMGVKVQGPDLDTIERFGKELEAILKEVPSLRAEAVFADRIVGKPYLEIAIDREAIGRYGLGITDVQEVLQIALGGETLTRTVEGRQRYGVRVRYMREERDSLEALERIFVPAPGGEPIPLGQLADIKYVRGPEMIKAENTFLTSYVLFDRSHGVAEVEAVEAAAAAIKARIDSGQLVVPSGVSYQFAGTYENQVRSERRLMVLIPIALAIIFMLLYLQFKRVALSMIIFSGVFVAMSGGFLLMWLYGRPGFLDFEILGTSMRPLFQVGTVNLSVAVWIGFISLVGIATDDGVVMSTYLQQRFGGARPASTDEVRAWTLDAGMRRVRPCLMTAATTVLALLPVVTSQGRGSDVMMPMALPGLGGMMIQLMTLFVVPVLYCALEEWRLRRAG